ncbi:hypothetical protein NQ315_006522 [Exocentrus adspersus]|uniref:Uncharacterized protein n=1 Tax=Exocentrus adspersus TaxID=1586481 RepID=A0AAV8W166_9CUCU|nr:hypothetical protein NQ315_006522 [Exocentrus adspersus]
MAETHCNTLKGQLDHMKLMYGVGRRSPKVRKISNISPPGGALSGSSTLDDGKENDCKPYPKRQNSNAISTDNTGAAVRTINNILNGITDSVNRLSELHVHISETPRSRKVRSTGVSPRKLQHQYLGLLEDSGNVEDTTGDVSYAQSHKSKATTRRRKDGKIINKKTVTSQQSIRRNNRAERKSRKASSVVDKNITAVMKKRVLHSLKSPIPSEHHNSGAGGFGSNPLTTILGLAAVPGQPHKLVEIYHNVAAKNSDSDEGNLQRSKTRRHGATQIKPHVNKSLVPPIDLPEKDGYQREEGEGDAPAIHLGSVHSGDPHDVDVDPLPAPRTELSCYSKNYELPTIASRMKQVAKSYLNSFTFKAIPFCAAISTSPSHNIGINIQQVMNIIKNRQPIKGISPTLAHNIGLAAERLNNRPLSALVSSIHSKTGYRMTPCPLSKTYFNYPQLQEMARGIPEETVEEVEEVEDEVDSPRNENHNNNRPVRGYGSEEPQRAGVGQPHQIRAVHLHTSKRGGVPAGGEQVQESRTAAHSEKHRASSESSKNCYHPNASSNTVKPRVTESETNPLQGREKNLKEVLTNLHDEFEILNKKYEDLANNASADDDDTLKELEKMEAELTKKEEEITMVMTLYKEVIALKQQIKSLKEKTSQASVNANPSNFKFKEYNNPQAAFHLTKLLRQIQHYQMRYKREFTGA